MKTTLAATLFALASLPLLAQQAPMNHPANVPSSQQNASQESSPAAAQQNSAAASAETATPQAPLIEWRPVNAQLVSKLDTMTAKAGDDVAVETAASVKTADGTEIPKGSKLVGHVIGVHPSGGQNSQVVLQFDFAELKDGKKLPIHTEIQSIAPAVGAATAGAASPAMNSATADNAPGPTSAATPGGATASGASRGASAAAEGAAGGTAAPAAGTIVSRNGKIAIRTTSVPGVLLANNAPGEQDPRMAQAAGILVGAQRDVQLDGGTQMVIGVASATASAK